MHYIYICVYIYIYMCLYIYIYIYIYSVCMYIFKQYESNIILNIIDTHTTYIY